MHFIEHTLHGIYNVPDSNGLAGENKGIYKYVQNVVGADHIFGMLILIWKDLGPMCFWSHGQSFSGKVYYTNVVACLPNS
jgi:hypothetical protein